MTTCKSCEYSQRQIDKLQKEIESLNKELALLQPPITQILPSAEDVKRWNQLLVGYGEAEMQKDVEATLQLSTLLKKLINK